MSTPCFKEATIRTADGNLLFAAWSFAPARFKEATIRTADGNGFRELGEHRGAGLQRGDDPHGGLKHHIWARPGPLPHFKEATIRTADGNINGSATYDRGVVIFKEATIRTADGNRPDPLGARVGGRLQRGDDPHGGLKLIID